MPSPFIAISLICLLFAGHAQADFNAHLGVETEYVRDGISQTHGIGAPQAGFNYHNNLGFYSGVWVSHINQKSNHAHSEWSAYGGLYLPLSESLILDTGLTRYTFTGDYSLHGQAYKEGFARLLLNHGWTFGLRYADNYMDTEKPKANIETAYTFKSGTFAIELYLSQHRFLETSESASFGSSQRDDYWHVRFGLERTYHRWDYRLQVQHTNLGYEYDASTIVTFGIHRYFDF